MIFESAYSATQRITGAGLAELRSMMADRRFADPTTFAHVRQELGIDAVTATDALAT